MPTWSVGVVACLAGCASVHRYPDGTGIEGQLEREVVALKIRVQELEGQLARAPVASSENELVPELVQVFSGSGVLVGPHGAGARLTVPVEEVFADTSELRVRGEGTMVFDLLATALTKHDDYDVHIVGHWSDRPSPRRASPSAMELTLDLARVFAEKLVAHDVQEGRIIVSGRGDSAPVTSNDLREGQDANERIDVILVVPPETYR